MHVREHKLNPDRAWQTLGMHDNARPMVPFWRDRELILPCIEDTTFRQVSETVWLVRAGESLDEAFEAAEYAFLGLAHSERFGTVYAFIELSVEGPKRRIAHPALLDQKSQEREPGGR